MLHSFTETIDSQRHHPLRNYMVLPDMVRSFNDVKLYIRDLLIAMQGLPYYVNLTDGLDENITVYNDCYDTPVQHQKR